MLKSLAGGLLALAVSTVAFAQADDPRKPPTFRLGDAATPLDYEATLAIDPKAERFEGVIRIRMRINRESPVVWMHARSLEVMSVEIRQGSRTFAAQATLDGKDFIGLDAKDGKFTVGEAFATIRYTGALEPLQTRGLFRQKEGGEWYVVSQFEADSARYAYPCFDEPGWKTPWQITIDAPATNFVASNTPEVRLTDAPRAGWKRHAFAITKPLPSYLIAMAIGPFDVVDGGTAGRNKTPLRYLAPKGRGAETRWAKESTPRILEILEDYFDMPYPFEKLDTVSIPQTVNFGAMENVGLITYASTLLLAKPEEESPAFKRRYAAVGAHEIAHMWFGNLVTLAWWDDTWLNESFATWMGQKAIGTYKPEWQSGWQRSVSRSRALFADRLPSARPLHKPVLERGDINAAFDRITYDKGAAVLSMFEAWLTPERFREGVRTYVKERAYGSATSRDFFKALGDAAGKGDEALAALGAFVNQPGIPLMDVTLRCESGVKPALEVKQSRLRPAGTNVPEMQWTTPACFTYDAPGGPKVTCAEIANGANRVPLSGVAQCPHWVAGNARGAGHYIVRFDEALTRQALLSLPTLPEAEAVALVSDAALLSRTGLLPMNKALVFFSRGLDHPAVGVQQAAIEALKVVHPEHLGTVGYPATATAKATIDREFAGALARKYGWTEKPNDTDAMRELRVVLLPYAADFSGDKALRTEARDRARQWLRNRGGADAMMVTPILDTAARFADTATYEALEAEALATTNQRDRRQLLSALAKVRDDKLMKRFLALSIEKRDGQDRIGGRDVLLSMDDALEEDAVRRPVFAWVRENFDALAAKLPPETPAQLTRELGRLCTPEDRKDYVAFFSERAPRYVGGKRRYELPLEAMDICIAARPRS
ncbi:hypothetical protein BWI17_05525 [Betaproteobacteria bacterium GR16-43]|nr:hypothetical protein BWI17_05525 [Betaproteobacteria bacterium GR16-43]